jgi:hypothetical protein
VVGDTKATGSPPEKHTERLSTALSGDQIDLAVGIDVAHGDAKRLEPGQVGRGTAQPPPGLD